MLRNPDITFRRVDSLEDRVRSPNIELGLPIRGNQTQERKYTLGSRGKEQFD